MPLGTVALVPISTGNPSADAADDFNRVRRQHVVGRLVARLRGAPDDIDVILPFDEVVAALGRRGLRDLGLRLVDLDTVVGTVDRTRDFDRQFRPTTNRPRQRFERLAAAIRRGEPIDPIDVYRVGEAHFVRDGHHRVAVARALGIPSLEAHVVEVLTEAGAGRDLRLRDLPVKSSERLFAERVPLPAVARARVRLSDPTGYGTLAENIEAWGYRAMQSAGDLLDRATVAERWYTTEYVPVVDLLREAELLGPSEPETEGYMRLACERWGLLQTWRWDDEVIERLRASRGRR
ncbi:MAG: chromosome partitioning protein ParB [Acidimicrobiales bacterium]|nr:chromosome partitioning protein ParB [Acidimicrobiales bacterium]